MIRPAASPGNCGRAGALQPAKHAPVQVPALGALRCGLPQRTGGPAGPRVCLQPVQGEEMRIPPPLATVRTAGTAAVKVGTATLMLAVCCCVGCEASGAGNDDSAASGGAQVGT